MAGESQSNTDGHVFRVDKFVVPPQAMTEFMQRVRQTHELLRQQPGFVRDAVLEQSAGPGEFNIVTIAEWQGQDAVDRARTLVKARHQSQGFDPQVLMKRLGIRADIGNYRSIDSSR